METVLGSIWWLIVSLGILVTFHEFGHFWVARRFGVRVERFSVGFGKALWQRRGADGTVYQIAAIPLGGYVKMLDERESDAPITEPERAFNRKPVGARMAIVAAGPLANLVLCVALLWLMFLVGKPEYQPLVGRAEGIAAEAGVRADDRILSVAGTASETWSHAILGLVVAATDRTAVDVVVADPSGDTRALQLPLQNLGADFDEARLLSEIGLIPKHRLLPPVIGEVLADSAAEAVGLQAGDRIISIDDRPVPSWDRISVQVAAAMAERDHVLLTIERDGALQTHEVRPRQATTEQGTLWLIGIAPEPRNADFDAVLRFGPIAAVGAALHETRRMTEVTLSMLWRMLIGRASLSNLSGPISIAQYANDSAQTGLAWFLGFLAMLSLSLAIINLLPIPILDGGHLLYYLIEWVKGGPLSERMLAVGQMVGLAMLAGLMGLAFYNDLFRVFG